MKTIEEAREFVIKQMDNDTPVSSAGYTLYHYGHCESEELLSFIYEDGRDVLAELDWNKK